MQTQDCKSTATSMAKNLNPVANAKTVDILSIRKSQLAIEKLIYTLSQTCLDLIYSG